MVLPFLTKTLSIFIPGVYVPTLAQKVTSLINSSALNLNFRGIAVGNGILSNFRQVDSYIDLSFYRGNIGKNQMEMLKSCCPYQNLEPAQICNYTATYLVFDPMTGEYGPNPANNSVTFQKCANAITNIGEIDMWGDIFADPYNFLQACYSDLAGFQDGLEKYRKVEKLRSILSQFTDSPIVTDGYSSFVDQGAKINTRSTDPFGGYRCYSNDLMVAYLNRADVKAAINIPAAAQNIVWDDCK